MLNTGWPIWPHILKRWAGNTEIVVWLDWSFCDYYLRLYVRTGAKVVDLSLITQRQTITQHSLPARNLRWSLHCYRQQHHVVQSCE
jgi:hypothetical protein